MRKFSTSFSLSEEIKWRYVTATACKAKSGASMPKQSVLTSLTDQLLREAFGRKAFPRTLGQSSRDWKAASKKGQPQATNWGYIVTGFGHSRGCIGQL